MQTTNNHAWISQYFGKPWESGAQGPDAYDCWALVRAVNHEVFGIDLPFISCDALNPDAIKATFNGNAEFNNWRMVDAPQNGDCVVTKSNPKDVDHVGVWVDVDGGKILQSVYGSGVVLITLEATKRMIGQHVEFWRHHSKC